MQDPKKVKKAKKQLKTMLKSLTRDQESFFKLGKFECKKTLDDGTIVSFSIVEPDHKAPRPRKRKPAKSTSKTANGAVAHAG